MKYPYYKCELHLHLDGSLSAKDGWEMAKQYHIDTGYTTFTEYEKHTHVDLHCNNLYDYLACFDLPLKILQYKQTLEACAYQLGIQLAKEHVRYAEIRFAPQQHIKRGLSQEEVIQAVLSGMEQAMKEAPILLQGILCMMILPQPTDKENAETLRLCKAYLHHGICALDLAGAEGVRDMSEFHPYFEQANAYGIPFTIHAGENGYPEHVKTAIAYGAKRIGHGVHCIEDQTVIEAIQQHHIPLEICYTSNRQCQVFPASTPHPVRYLFDSDIPITINTDNRCISHTTLDQEYDRLEKDFHFTITEIRKCNETAIRYSFLDEQRKAELLQEMSIPIFL